MTQATDSKRGPEPPSMQACPIPGPGGGDDVVKFVLHLAEAIKQGP